MTQVSKPISLSPRSLIDHYDQQFSDSLVEMYPKAEDRAIVIEVILPQLRTELKRVVGEFEANRKLPQDSPLTPAEIPKLCDAIGRMIKENRELLFVDSYFKRGMIVVQDYRVRGRECLMESFYEECRRLLRKHGIIDRQSLVKKGEDWFKSSKADFKPYGKARAFAAKIVGHPVKRLSKSILYEISEKLGLSKVDSKTIDQYHQTLARNGITNRESLLEGGINGSVVKMVRYFFNFLQNSIQFLPNGSLI